MTVDQLEEAPSVARWRAIGTYVHLAVGESAALAEAQALAEEVLDEVDRACSRFRADSDLNRANAAAGTWVRVHPLLAAATQAAVGAAYETDGLVDPCLGRTIVSLGYDRTFQRLLERDPDQWATQLERPRADAWREVAVDLEGRVRVPTGVSLDLGATAKAWASDLIALTVYEELGVSALVSLGGDIRIAPDDEAGWPVNITERPDEIGGETILLHSGGLATSSTRVRRWTTRGGEFHHLLDPRTGLPAEGPWCTATVTASSSLSANTATTAALVLGAEAVNWLTERSVTARLIGRDGQVQLVGDWPISTVEGV